MSLYLSGARRGEGSCQLICSLEISIFFKAIDLKLGSSHLGGMHVKRGDLMC